MTKKLLVVIPARMPTTEIIMRSLEHLKPEYEVQLVLANELDVRLLFEAGYQLLFIRLHDPSLNPLLKLLLRHNVQYLYYLDDNFWELRCNTPIGLYYQQSSVINTLNKFILNAKQIVTGSKNLKNYIVQHFHPGSVTHIDAAFDFDLINNLEKAPKSGVVKIIYSASMYRDQDFACALEALKKIAEEFSDRVEIYFYGYMPAALKNRKNVFYDEKYYEYGQYIKKQYQGNFDIGLAPLADTLSSRAKSNLKYREYSACGIVGIYSNIPPYADCIESGKNGILVETTTAAWYEALKELIENKPLREQIAATAEHDVRERYSQQRIATEWKKIIESAPVTVTQTLTWQNKWLYRVHKCICYVYYKIVKAYKHWRYHGFIATLKRVWAVLNKG